MYDLFCIEIQPLQCGLSLFYIRWQSTDNCTLRSSIFSYFKGYAFALHLFTTLLYFTKCAIYAPWCNSVMLHITCKKIYILSTVNITLLLRYTYNTFANKFHVKTVKCNGT